MKWIDLKKQKPKKGTRVLVCDDNGYVDVQEWSNWRKGMGMERGWLFGNGTRLVAWMPLPAWPSRLCWEDADGLIP
jgi:hypothetical protein